MRDLTKIKEIGVETCSRAELIEFLKKYFEELSAQPDELMSLVRMHFGNIAEDITALDCVNTHIEMFTNDDLADFVTLTFGCVEDCNFDTDLQKFVIDIDPDID